MDPPPLPTTRAFLDDMPRPTSLLVLALAPMAAALPVGRWIGRTVRRRFGRPPRRPSLAPDDAQDVALAGANGRTLRGWLFRGDGSTRAAVAVMHGWGASAGDLVPAARMLAAAGLHTLVLDARCHGRSDSDDFASMPRFAEDLETGVAWLRAQSFVDPDRVAVLGHSVGAGAALLVAARDPRIAGVVSVSSMAHPGRFMQTALVRQRVPRPLASGALRYVERVIGHRYDDFAPLRSVTRIQSPLLLVHGDADTVVPVSDARLLQAAARTHAELVVVPDAGHDDLEALQTVAVQVLDLLRVATGSAAPVTGAG